MALTPSWRFVFVLIALTAIVRFIATAIVGWGDSEALYALYSQIPQPLYVDHPGAIGVFGRMIGLDNNPSPFRAHLVSSAIATLVPLFGAWVATRFGATIKASTITAVAIACCPQTAIGLFAWTPDLPFSVFLLLTMALFAEMIKKPKGMNYWLVSVIAAVTIILALWSKLSGVLLVVALGLFFIDSLRKNEKYWGVLFAAFIGAMGFALLVWIDQKQNWAMFSHRLVDTQSKAGFSFRNIGAVVGGQLGYVSPLLAIAGVYVLVDLVQRGDQSPQSRALRALLVGTGIPLLVLCLWSRVAEPHWLAPVWVILAVAAPQFGKPPMWVIKGALPIALGSFFLVVVYCTTNIAPHLPKPLYQPKYDLSNDLYAWGDAFGENPPAPILEKIMATNNEAPQTNPTNSPYILTPHWTIAARVQLATSLPTQTTHAVSDDFKQWNNKFSASSAPIAVVWDDRFERPNTPPCAEKSEYSLIRAGKTTRVIYVEINCAKEQ